MTNHMALLDGFWVVINVLQYTAVYRKLRQHPDLYDEIFLAVFVGIAIVALMGMVHAMAKVGP
jgi:hypothetical protein